MRPFVELTAAIVFAATLAHAEPRSLTVVPHPLEFDPRPELVASNDKLRAAWVEAVREAGVVTPSRKEVEASLAELKRRDCKTADDCLAGLAVKGAGLYAVHAFLELSEGGVFVVTARVVRDDGKLMASFSMERARGDKKKQPLLPLVKQVLSEAVRGLGVSGLPAFKEAAPAPAVTVPVVVATPVVVAEPPPPAPPVVPLVAAETRPRGETRRIVGFAVMGSGLTTAVAGGVVLLITSGQARALNPQGGPLLDEAQATLDRARSLNTQHFVGLGLVGGGVVAALFGLVFAVTAPSDTPLVLAPVPGGLVAALGGVWP